MYGWYKQVVQYLKKMIEIIKIEKLNDLTFEKCQTKFTDNILPDFIFDILRFENEDYFCIDFSNDFSSKNLYEIFDCNFDDFLINEGKSQDYEISLPFSTLTGSDLFDSFTTTIYIGKRNKNAYLRIQIAQDFYLENTKWSKYSPFYLHEKLIELGFENIIENIIITEGEDDTEELVKIQFRFNLSENINEALKSTFNSLPKIEQDLEKFINQSIWNEDFLKDEPKFSKELILPLLRKMKFDNVIYNHGKKEYGRDFFFSEINKFNEPVYYGMQVKAGDVSGRVNSEIDMLIGQLNDAFSMPFYILGNQNPYYISSFVIAISGKFMENAKEKIIHKIPKELLGNVYFWDKEKMLELIEKNWIK